jgi:hypothetical protein
LTLSGVIKDILLVVLSVIIWSTPVTTLQIFGYGLALGGLIYYKIGIQALRSMLALFGDDQKSGFRVLPSI